MKRLISIPEVSKVAHLKNNSVIKIIESTKNSSSNVSYSTRVDRGFIQNLSELGKVKVVGIEIDPITNIMIISFESNEDETELIK